MDRAFLDLLLRVILIVKYAATRLLAALAPERHLAAHPRRRARLPQKLLIPMRKLWLLRHQRINSFEDFLALVVFVIVIIVVVMGVFVDQVFNGEGEC